MVRLVEKVTAASTFCSIPKCFKMVLYIIRSRKNPFMCLVFLLAVILITLKGFLLLLTTMPRLF